MTVTVEAERGSDFAKLAQKIKQAGLLDRRPGYYTLRIGLVVTLLLGGWAAFLFVGDSWWQLLVGAVLAVAFAQLALVAHDLAHRQVFRGKRITEVCGMIAGNVGIGMSYGWWMNKHTRHHANPNHEDHDPDVNPDVLVWSTRQASQARGLARFVGKWQGFLFFPLLLLEGFQLHIASARALTSKTMKRRWTEGVLLYGHFVVYLGCTFAPNHKGMPTLTGADNWDYLRKQVLTSRNVRGGVWVDVLLGGLNYQIEHHLFPNMPTPNLRKAQPMVQQFCEEVGVSYLSCGFIESYSQALRHLHAAGAPLRA